MAVDRGGLRYTIEVRDQFSRQLNSFRQQVRAIKKELGDLRGAQAQLNAVRNQSSAAQSGADRAQLDRLRQIQAGIKQQQQVENLRAQIFRAQRNEAQQSAREEIELFRRRKAEEAQAAKQRASALRKEQTAQARANREVREGARSFETLTRSVRNTEGAVNRVSFTFRRLFGILAAFQAARAGLDLFRGAVSQGIEFNRTIEDSTISLAALFTAAGRVSEEIGGPALQGAEAFAAATSEARRQVDLLRQDALGTTATFQELLKAFQAGVGPGLEAGLGLDEIREVTVRVSQAAQALLVPQNQLIEEIRSLLRGTIQARTTIVASVLGIDNEDIRRAKEAGNLFEFLRERLGPFAEAAEATRGSFSGLIARIRDATSIVSGEAATGLFQSLKNALLDLFDALTDIDEVTGTLKANEDAVRTLTPLFDGLAEAVRAVSSAASSISLDALQGAAGAVGNIIRLLAVFGAAAVQGLVEGVNDLARLFGALSDEADGLELSTLAEMLRLVLRVGTILVGVNLALGTTRSIMLALAGPVFAVARGFNFIAASVVSLIGTTKGLAIAITSGLLLGLIAAGVVLKSIIDDFAGFNVRISTFFRIISEGFINLITVVGASLEVAFVTIFAGASQLLAEFISFALNKTSEFLTVLAKGANIFGPEVSQPIEDAAGALAIASSRFDDAARNAGSAIAAAQNDLTNASVKFFEDINAAITDDQDGVAASASELANGFLDTLTTTISGGLDTFFGDLGGDLGIDLEGAEEEGKKLGGAIVRGANNTDEEVELTALEKYFTGIVENFENGLALIRPLVQQLSSFISDAIVDAFDPTNDTDLLERFARFLQSIAKLIIQQLVQIAIARAVLGLSSVPVVGEGGDAATPAISRAEGGEIPGGHRAPRLARPKGIDPRDTTPVWAQPGEFMLRLAAVKRYGRDAIQALNDGLVDPAALQSLLGKRSRRHLAGMASRGPRGYAEGGIIRQATSASASTASRAAAAPAGPTPAVIVANDQTMDKLLAGGGQAFRRYLSDNASEIDGILRRGRTGG